MQVDASTPVAARRYLGERIRSGDLVFINARVNGVWSWLRRTFNNCGQRALAAMRLPWFKFIPAHSHVMLGIDGGLIVHADGKSVSIDLLDDLLVNAMADFKVYRYEGLSGDVGDTIVNAAVRYHFQQYSFLSYLKAGGRSPRKADTTQFCSRLISYAYRAAHIELTPRQDHRVLPIDLFVLCQHASWKDVTKDFHPTRGEIMLSPIFEKADVLLRQAAKQQRRMYFSKYKSISNVINVEAQLAQLRVAQFKRAKLIQSAPQYITVEGVAVIAQAFQQVEAVLKIALLPTIEDLVKETLLVTIEGPDPGPYVGLAPPSEVRKMQVERELLVAFCNALLAEIGLMSIVAHYGSPNAANEIEVIPRLYIDRLLAEAPAITDLAQYEDQTLLYRWVKDEVSRSNILIQSEKVIRGIKLVNQLR